MIETAGAKLFYLPPYSADLNPIELAFSKFSPCCAKPLHALSTPSGKPSEIVFQAFSVNACQNSFMHPDADLIQSTCVGQHILLFVDREIPASPCLQCFGLEA